jgi:hypothetical protein
MQLHPSHPVSAIHGMLKNRQQRVPPRPPASTICRPSKPHWHTDSRHPTHRGHRHFILFATRRLSLPVFVLTDPLQICLLLAFSHALGLSCCCPTTSLDTPPESRPYGAGNAPSTSPRISLVNRWHTYAIFTHVSVTMNGPGSLLSQERTSNERSTRTTHSALSCSFSFVPIQTLSTLSILTLHNHCPLPPRHRLSVIIPLGFDPHISTRHPDLGEDSIPFQHAPSVGALLH